MTEVSRMFYNDPAHHKPFEIFRHNMFWTWPKRIMWTVASTLNRTKNYCFRLLSLIAENNTTQNLEYQTNSQPTGNKNELVSTVISKGALFTQNKTFCSFWNRLNWGVENIFSLKKMICETTNRWIQKRKNGKSKSNKIFQIFSPMGLNIRHRAFCSN